MAKGTTTLVTMTGYVEYARVFPANMDNGDYHSKTQGQYNVNFYPKNNAGFEEYFKAGVPMASMGYDTIKIGNPQIATGKYLKLKRPNVHPLVSDWGGAPAVFDFREGLGMKKWDMDVDGEIGNGSEVIVKVSVWGDGGKSIQRLEKIAVLKLVEYDPAAQGSGIDMDNF